MTFGVEGQKRRFSVDLVPRLISPHEWHTLAEGLIQRARAIEAFLADVYGEQRILAEGVLRRDHVEGAPGWRAEASRLPAGTDPGADHGLRPGAQRVRRLAGARGQRAQPERCGVRDRDPGPAGRRVARPARARRGCSTRPTRCAQLRECLLAQVGPDGTVALLSEGPGAAAWFEHRLLAERGGLLLTVADDLMVAEGEVRHRDTGARIDALYLRLDGELVDLADSAGQPIGAEIFEVAVAGGVFLANAPGNGVADDKAMYCNVPELIGYYLGEHPTLESVPTYRTSDEAEARIVLDRVGELVTKPVDGHGGLGVLIGPDASAAEVAERRSAIAAEPAGWVAQEVVALSSHPTLSGTRLQPRHVDLRAFVYLRGTQAEDCTLADLALTRVAPAGSLVVNSSRGGGAKDTWIIGARAS